MSEENENFEKQSFEALAKLRKSNHGYNKTD